MPYRGCSAECRNRIQELEDSIQKMKDVPKPKKLWKERFPFLQNKAFQVLAISLVLANLWGVAVLIYPKDPPFILIANLMILSVAGFWRAIR